MVNVAGLSESTNESDTCPMRINNLVGTANSSRLEPDHMPPRKRKANEDDDGEEAAPSQAPSQAPQPIKADTAEALATNLCRFGALATAAPLSVPPLAMLTGCFASRTYPAQYCSESTRGNPSHEPRSRTT